MSISNSSSARLSSVALRVFRMEAMVAFYQEAFGFVFRSVRTGPYQSQFGRLGSLTLKLVPLSEEGDRDENPSHQLGFSVPDLEAVVVLAEKYGGGQAGKPLLRDGIWHTAIRDPDGYTVELYGHLPDSPDSPDTPDTPDSPRGD